MHKVPSGSSTPLLGSSHNLRYASDNEDPANVINSGEFQTALEKKKKQVRFLPDIKSNSPQRQASLTKSNEQSAVSLPPISNASSRPPLPPGPAKPLSKIPKLKQRVESEQASIASEQHSTSLPSSSREVAKEYYKVMKKS